jgi:type IV secretion system protein VirD4
MLIAVLMMLANWYHALPGDAQFPIFLVGFFVAWLIGFFYVSVVTALPGRIQVLVYLAVVPSSLYLIVAIHQAWPGPLPGLLDMGLYLFGGLVILWVPLVVLITAIDGENGTYVQRTAHGSARWTTTNELIQAKVLNRGIYLGVTRSAETVAAITYSGPSHLITCAPPRSGKARDVLFQAIMSYPGSCIVIDPKCEAAAVTKQGREAKGFKSINLNPYGTFSEIVGPSDAYNPMDNLNPNSRTFSADCDALTDSLVWRTTNDGGNSKHFLDGAANLINGVIQNVVRTEPPENRNLLRVRAIIAMPSNFLGSYCAQAAAGKNPIIRNKLGRFAEINDNTRELLSIVNTANQQLDFLDDECIAESLCRSTFRFSDFQRQPMTGYIVLPLARLATNSKYFRLIIAGLLNELLREQKAGPVPVLTIVDEAAQLGKMSAIYNTLGMGAGMGVQLWTVWQSLTQISDIYGQGWEAFLGCAGVRQFFRPTDHFTAQYISQLCGVTTIETQSAGQHYTPPSPRTGNPGATRLADMIGTMSTSSTASTTQRPLLYPDEVLSLKDHEQLLWIDPLPRAIIGSRIPYWDERNQPNLRDYFAPNPYHRMRPTVQPRYLPKPAAALEAREEAFENPA